MERLEFGGTSRYVAIEAAIHVARYLTVRDLCRGRNVLDVACGEGYGSSLMSQWGAKSVLGVDVSSDAVKKAGERFGSGSVQFVSGSGEALSDCVQDKRFELIVSLETIEHVDDPERFLANIKAAAAPGATIVISAPNDYWYYKFGGQNEYHKRRFTLEEFQSLTERVLGKANAWCHGTLGIGFSVAKEGALKSGNGETPQDLMLEFQNIDSAVFVPSQIESDATSAEVAFYIGVWGPQSIPESVFAGYPVSMDLGRQALFPKQGIWAIKRDPHDPNNDEAVNNALMREVGELRANEMALGEQIESLRKAADSIGEKLHFSEKEIERLGMSRRAAQAEVQVAWRAIHRHEHAAREMQAALDQARNAMQTEATRLGHIIEVQRASIDTANAHLANVPWNVVRAWWLVRRVIPKPILRFVGVILNSMRRSHAN